MTQAWTSQVARSDPGAGVAVQFRSKAGTIISVTLQPETDLNDPEDAVAFARKVLSQCASDGAIEAPAPRTARPAYETDELYRFWATGR